MYTRNIPSADATYFINGIASKLVGHDPFDSQKCIFARKGEHSNYTVSFEEFDQQVNNGEIVQEVIEDHTIRVEMTPAESDHYELMKNMVLTGYAYLKEYSPGSRYGGVAARDAIISLSCAKYGYQRRPKSQSKKVQAGLKGKYALGSSQLLTVMKVYEQEGEDGLRRIATSKPGAKRNSNIVDATIRGLGTEFINRELLRDHSIMPQLSYVYALFKDEFNTRKSKGDPAFQRKVPCYNTFSRWAKRIAPQVFDRAMYGADGDGLRSRNAISKSVADYPLQIVQMDGQQINLGIKDKHTGEYLGPLKVYTAIDVCTRSVMGMAFTVGTGELTDGVIECIRHMRLKKPEYAFGEHWVQHGTPREIVIDGGAAFKSKKVAKQLATLGVDHKISRAKRGDDKAIVEAFNDTLAEFCANNVQGYVPKQKDNRKVARTLEQSRHYTLDEATTIIFQWVATKYHTHSHAGLYFNTPLKAWNEGIKKHPLAPEAEHFNRIRLVRPRSTTCKLTGPDFHLGVQVQKIRFNDAKGRLKDIGKRLDRDPKLPLEVEVWYSEGDASAVTILDPYTNELFEAFATDDIDEGTSFNDFHAAHPEHPREGTLHMTEEECPTLKRNPAYDRDVKKESRKDGVSTEELAEELQREARENEPFDDDTQCDESDGLNETDTGRSKCAEPPVSDDPFGDVPVK